MNQKYQVDNLTSRFIKALLWDTYIPAVDIWKPGKPLVDKMTYITNDKYIVKAKKDYNGTDLNGPKSALDERYFNIIEPYIEGKFYPGVTSNFKSNSSLYDSDTHYMLGQYLRMLRDLHELDLMPFYNCFDGTTSNKIRINQQNNQDTLTLSNNIDDGLITYIVPVKYNREYSLYYNSSVPFKVKPVYYDGITLAPLKNISNNTEIQSSLVRYCSFNSPYIVNSIDRLAQYDVTDNPDAKLIEDYLCLLIQAPKNELSNLVVLEGNYKDVTLNNLNNINHLPAVLYGDKDDVLKLSQEDINDILKPYSSLLYNNTGVNYAFSDRLIEYLLLSPIIAKDKIRDNIKRIQEYLTSNKAKKEFGKIYPYEYKKDIWDNLLRLYIYNLVIEDKKSPLFLDINGFVDKDSEFIIDRGKESGGNLNV